MVIPAKPHAEPALSHLQVRACNVGTTTASHASRLVVDEPNPNGPVTAELRATRPYTAVISERTG